MGVVVHLLSRSHDYTASNKQKATEGQSHYENSVERCIAEDGFERSKDDDQAQLPWLFPRADCGPIPIQHTRTAIGMPRERDRFRRIRRVDKKHCSFCNLASWFLRRVMSGWRVASSNNMAQIPHRVDLGSPGRQIGSCQLS